MSWASKVWVELGHTRVSTLVFLAGSGLIVQAANTQMTFKGPHLIFNGHLGFRSPAYQGLNIEARLPVNGQPYTPKDELKNK